MVIPSTPRIFAFDSNHNGLDQREPGRVLAVCKKGAFFPRMSSQYAETSGKIAETSNDVIETSNRRGGEWQYIVLASALFLLTIVLPSLADPGYKLEIDETRWVTIGAGLRTSFRAEEDASPNRESYSKDFNLDNMRLYLNGQVLEKVQIEFNTEFDNEPAGTEDVRILDALVKFDFNEAFRLWAGRHLPPSDRANLDGPYFLATFDYPGLVSRYPAIFAGRDDGVSVNGDLGAGKFKYALGIFEGVDQAPNNDDHLLYAWRITYHFWDPEPGYYTSSTYYGEKNIFAIAFAGQFQADAINNAGKVDDFVGFNADLLLEKKLTNEGVITLEGAVYDYDRGGAAGDGLAFLVLGGYLIPMEIGWGKFQPHVRYQDFEDEASRIDFGLNYVIKGHSARISLVYSFNDPDGPGDANQFLVGAQFQF